MVETCDTKIQVRVTKTIRKKADKLAAWRSVRVTMLIRQLINEAFEREEKKRAK